MRRGAAHRLRCFDPRGGGRSPRRLSAGAAIGEPLDASRPPSPVSSLPASRRSRKRQAQPAGAGGRLPAPATTPSWGIGAGAARAAPSSWGVRIGAGCGSGFRTASSGQIVRAFAPLVLVLSPVDRRGRESIPRDRRWLMRQAYGRRECLHGGTKNPSGTRSSSDPAAPNLGPDVIAAARATIVKCSPGNSVIGAARAGSPRTRRGVLQ